MPAVRLAFAGLCYLLFFATFLWLVGFVGNLVIPRSIDFGPSVGMAGAAVIDIALIALFGVQHSVMARPGFKARITKVVHPSLERSFYVLSTVAVLWVLFTLWQPIPWVVWSVSGTGAAVLWALFALGWAVVFLSTWMLDHFELFGLRQAWFGYRGTEDGPPRFREPMFYRVVRHPLYVGFLFAFWAIPVMTFGHLLFAAGMTAYILIAIRYEERDLINALGDAYRDYQRRVGKIVPGIGKIR
ncbi:methanethiol S-methyltransferase [Croceicoccus naphthovorans]|uniref:methanethiol S-methyltransferase n=1 Tax=Croceicoccus naphthovorans TaxID=1348774 RepID=A0A0G3XG50_9SPHN|nr:methanethiol S-methyltransferase [Croceicoccus naphthovorans]AKM09574.1 membrane protein [Croceicoccus naphthovorans]MBB3989658.1 protein-S-isoprenylcysteine O-methyltransferase Ste14 [Croceicoccus naphthovorans]